MFLCKLFLLLVDLNQKCQLRADRTDNRNKDDNLRHTLALNVVETEIADGRGIAVEKGSHGESCCAACSVTLVEVGNDGLVGVFL